MLISHLHVVFRGMAGSGMALVEMVQRANRLFGAVSPENAFATLAAARLTTRRRAPRRVSGSGLDPRGESPSHSLRPMS